MNVHFPKIPSNLPTMPCYAVLGAMVACIYGMLHEQIALPLQRQRNKVALALESCQLS
jgi:hypothetical protein